MAVYLRATKTGFAKLLRSRGMDIPSIRSAWFSRFLGTAWLEWLDIAGNRRKATLTAAAGRPIYWVDCGPAEELSMAEVIQYGLYEEK